jgi:hypothetical protein
VEERYKADLFLWGWGGKRDGLGEYKVFAERGEEKV